MTGHIDEIKRVKWERYFGFLDLDGSGYVEWSDLQGLVDRHLEAFGADPADDRAVRFQVAYEQLWNVLIRHVDVGGDGRVSKQEFLTGVESAAAADFPAAIDRVVDTLFDVMDVDGDGLVSGDDFARLMSSAGANRSEVLQGFAAIDADGDGYLSREEVLRVGQEFWFSDDLTKPGNQAFGPLRLGC